MSFNLKNSNPFVTLFCKFMEQNKRYSFSLIELEAIGLQLNKILNVHHKYSGGYVNKILMKNNINVLNKYSKSLRHKLWFLKDLDPQTLKTHINV